MFPALKNYCQNKYNDIIKKKSLNYEGEKKINQILN